MWGIIPAAGAGTRIQPLAFSKELLPVGCRFDGETERPRAVSEYILERMVMAGANKICFVISPGKSERGRITANEPVSIAQNRRLIPRQLSDRQHVSNGFWHK